MVSCRAQSLYCASSLTKGHRAPGIAKRRNKAIAPYDRRKGRVALQGPARDLTRQAIAAAYFGG